MTDIAFANTDKPIVTDKQVIHDNDNFSVIALLMVL